MNQLLGNSDHSTEINCTVKEAASRISKIQLQIEIMHATSEHFVFPRLKKPSEFNDHTNCFDLPSKVEIHSEIENCQKDAINTVKEFGLIRQRSANVFPCTINPHKMKLTRGKRCKSASNARENIAELDLNNIKLKDYTGKLKETEIHSTSPYIEIMNEYGEQTIVKKTSLCWLLREDSQKLSSDRLIRVQNPRKKLYTTQPKKFKIKSNKRACKQMEKRTK